MNTSDVNILSMLLGGNQLAESAPSKGSVLPNFLGMDGLPGVAPAEGTQLPGQFDVLLDQLLSTPSGTEQSTNLSNLIAENINNEASKPSVALSEIVENIIPQVDQPETTVQSLPVATILSPAPSSGLIDEQNLILPIETDNPQPAVLSDGEVSTGRPSVANGLSESSELADRTPLVSSPVTGLKTESDNITIGKNEPFMVFPQSTSTLPELIQLETGSQTQLPSGKYDVQSWFSDGKMVHLDVVRLDGVRLDGVRLDVAQPDQPGSTVRISIPLERLTDMNVINNESQPRVLLEGTGQQKLTSLLSQYDIKEISLAPLTDSPEKQAPALGEREMGIKIIALNTGQEMVIRANLSRYALSQKNIVKNSANTLSSSEAGQVDIDPDNIVPNRTESPSRPVLTPVRPILPTTGNLAHELLKSSELNLADKTMTSLSTLGGQAEESSDILPMFTRTTTELTLPREKVDLQPIRFVLPDNLKSHMKPNGQSIRLVIEPDNLGPARLSLHLHNNRLRAVVVVESTQAKMAIEGSLDRLLTALEKADVQVDRIDVHVGQQNTREQLFRQQHQATMKSLSQRPFLIEDELENIAEQNSLRPLPEPSYIGSGGVNLLA